MLVLSRDEELANVLRAKRLITVSAYDKINTPDGGLVLRSFNTKNTLVMLC